MAHRSFETDTTMTHGTTACSYKGNELLVTLRLCSIYTPSAPRLLLVFECNGLDTDTYK